MSLSKNQTVAAAALGAWAVAAAGLGYMYYAALTARQDAQDDFRRADANIDAIYQSKIFPDAKSISAVKTNEAAYIEWQKEALAAAAAGDRTFAPMSGVQFKQLLVGRVEHLSSLAGGAADGKLAGSGFKWSFDKELAEQAAIPDRDKTPALQAQLDLVSDLAETMEEAGVVEVRSIQKVDAPAVQAQDKNAKKPQRNQKQKEPEKSAFEKSDFEIEFTARPAAIVKVLNALVDDYRFTVVTSLTIKQSDDQLVRKLAGNSEEEQNAGRRGRRRRQAAVAEEQAEGGSKNLLVTDPETDPPLLVAMKFSVYDFLTAQPGSVPPSRKSKADREEEGENDAAGEKPAVAEEPADGVGEAAVPAQEEGEAQNG
ncbi:MAG: Amuc_1100 family pilus-like protein [Kiritimatiellae bacterium]|nr:Amuc_1100 family pilus-like protein [Kiritimatiellia bacterium]